MNKYLATLIATVVIVAGCSTSGDVTPPPSPTPTTVTTESPTPATDDLAVPTDGLWLGQNSPVLEWTEDERDQYMASIAEQVRAGMDAVGLTGDEDILLLTRDLGTALPRAAREILLLSTVDVDSDNAAVVRSLESAMLQSAWDSCLAMDQGTPYGRLAVGADVLALGHDYDSTEPLLEATHAVSTGVWWASVVCFQHAEAAIEWHEEYLPDARDASSPNDTSGTEPKAPKPPPAQSRPAPAPKDESQTPYEPEPADDFDAKWVELYLSYVIEDIAVADERFLDRPDIGGSSAMMFLEGDMERLLDEGAPPGADQASYYARIQTLADFFRQAGDQLSAGDITGAAATYSVAREELRPLVSTLNGALGTSHALPAWSYISD